MKCSRESATGLIWNCPIGKHEQGEQFRTSPRQLTTYPLTMNGLVPWQLKALP